MYLIFDTETNGKADFKLPPEHEAQPRLVQLGAILYDSTFEIMAEVNLIVKPEGFVISKELSDIHGITQEMAETYGMNEKAVLLLFSGLMRKAEYLIAHNIQFDGVVMGRAFHIHKVEHTLPKNQRCTMKEMTNICKIRGSFGFKWPNLMEAYKHCFNETFEGAHDAMADVRACGRIFRWLMERKA